MFARIRLHTLKYLMDREQLLSELSHCVRCGSCHAQCPTYEEGLTETMTARGRLVLLRSVLKGELSPTPGLLDRIYSCILCGACEPLCPPRVNITSAIYEGRRLLKDTDRKRRLIRSLSRFVLRNPNAAFRAARTFQAIGIPPERILSLLKTPMPVTLPAQTLRNEQQVFKPGKRIGRVAVFTGCTINYIYPHLGISLINVLLSLGYEVVLPAGEVCCGVPLRGLGLADEAELMARKNHAIFSRLNTEAILSLCPTCVVSLRSHYPELIGKGLGIVMDASEFLAGRIKDFELRTAPSLTSVTFHDPCHLGHSLGIRKEPRELIRAAGLELIEAASEGCCGFGGLFSLQYPGMSRSLLEHRAGVLLKTGAAGVVTACPGCVLHLSAGLPGRPVLHFIELLDEAFHGQ